MSSFSTVTPRVGGQYANALPAQIRRLVLVGAPGAGKSSQGTRLAGRLAVPHVSTGELLREEVRRGSPVGQQANEYVRAGELVPDWLVLFVLERRLSNALEVGFVLDGYPRTLEQAQRFMRSLGRVSLDLVIELAVSDEVAIGRLAARMACGRCGQPSRDLSSVRCARCDSELQRRSDDDGQVVRARLLTHRRQTEPMLEFFAKEGLLVTIDGDRPEDAVAAGLVRLVR